MKRIFIVAGIAMLSVMAGAYALPVHAQEAGVPIYTPMDELYDNRAPDDKYAVKDEYVPSTIQNLSKLYWALGALDPKDDQAIDNFLRINECALFSKYYEKDLELRDIRESTREYIQMNLGKFSTKMEFVIPLGLDRYDVDKETFMLDPKSYLLNVKRMQLYETTLQKAICGFTGNYPGYPNIVILNFSRPINFKEFKVAPAVADLYIEQAKELAMNNVDRYMYSKFGRIAYLRLKVSIIQFKDIESQRKERMAANVVAVIDGYEIYADRNKRLLMYSAKFDVKRMLRRKKPLNNNKGGVPDRAPPPAPNATAPAPLPDHPTPQPQATEQVQ